MAPLALPDVALPPPQPPAGASSQLMSAPLAQLLSQHVPGWAGVTTDTLLLTPMCLAMSNLVFRVTCAYSPHAPALLLKLYGDGRSGGSGGDAPPSLVDRDHELRAATHLSSLGMGPDILLVWPGGRVEKWLHAAPLLSEEMREPIVAASLASSLASFHAACRPLLSSPRDALWARMRRWAADAAAQCGDLSADARFGPTLLLAPAWIDALHAALGDLPTSFVHADVQHLNVLKCVSNAPCSAQTSGEPVVLQLIDFEYAMEAPACFDVGNHFCERAADYSPGAEHRGGMLSYSDRYPSLAARVAFCAAFLGGGVAGSGAGEAEALAGRAEVGALASHLLWGCWGVIKAKASPSADFDYGAYADARFAELRRHAERLGFAIPQGR